MLFDLKADEGEVLNIADKHREVHRDLFGEMMRYFEEVGARIPKKNPGYDPAAYKATKEYEDRARWEPFEGRRELDEDERPSFARPKNADPIQPTNRRRPIFPLLLAQVTG